MIWQDWVISIGTWVILIALLQSVFSKDKPDIKTSIMTGTVLVAFALSYATLGLATSAVSTSLIAATWYVLAFQKFLINRRSKN